MRPPIPVPGPARYAKDDPIRIREDAEDVHGWNLLTGGCCGGVPLGLVGLLFTTASVTRER
ncbi:hypothetical protein BH10PLA1_BH10PLA1_14750 [soil metagenome]